MVPLCYGHQTAAGRLLVLRTSDDISCYMVVDCLLGFCKDCYADISEVSCLIVLGLSLHTFNFSLQRAPLSDNCIESFLF